MQKARKKTKKKNTYNKAQHDNGKIIENAQKRNTVTKEKKEIKRKKT